MDKIKKIYLGCKINEEDERRIRELAKNIEIVKKHHKIMNIK